MTMSEISLRAARTTDRSSVVSLLHACALSSEGVDPELSGFFVAEGPVGLVGAAGLEQYDVEGLLRSVAVAPEARGLGLGARLTEAVLAEARRRGLTAVYALTTTAERYFPRLGFEVIDRSEVADSIRQSAEFRSICPASAVALRVRLDG